jgi:DNA-binding MarR family transcriptional regulator
MPEPLSPDPLDLPLDAPDRRRLPILLRRAWYGLNQAFRRRILHTGLTPDQFTALRNLQEAGRDGLIQSQLTERMSSDPNTIASLVDRMNKAGLIDRCPDLEDRRAYRLRINARGRRAYHEARRIAISLQATVLEAINTDDHDKFLEQLNAVADACLNAAGQSPKK